MVKSMTRMPIIVSVTTMRERMAKKRRIMTAITRMANSTRPRSKS